MPQFYTRLAHLSVDMEVERGLQGLRPQLRHSSVGSDALQTLNMPGTWRTPQLTRQTRVVEMRNNSTSLPFLHSRFNVTITSNAALKKRRWTPTYTAATSSQPQNLKTFHTSHSSLSAGLIPGSLRFFIDLILPDVPRPCGRLSP